MRHGLGLNATLRLRALSYIVFVALIFAGLPALAVAEGGEGNSFSSTGTDKTMLLDLYVFDRFLTSGPP